MTQLAARQLVPQGSGAEPVQLPPSCTIHEMAQLHDLLATRLLATEPVEVDACHVERCDAAALQLFVAFTRGRAKMGWSTTWTGCDGSFARAVSGVALETVIAFVRRGDGCE
jgi:hypothetical protein